MKDEIDPKPPAKNGEAQRRAVREYGAKAPARKKLDSPNGDLPWYQISRALLPMA